ncbi:hypothetical protein KUV62_20600 [Salipiger bermudensis]|uniref:hypothetical protein n=1 Tax=Salipiger bermudensis TaxID=344736 RepID=UPI001C99A7C1|nr:hypothetical protein [Salipiger bermudensis]MBY6006335.1 hypothetical protein [Salipiger bermudensis]
MRVFLTNFYQLAHRAAGIYAGIATLGFFASVPLQISSGRHVIIPIVISLLAFVAAVFLARPSSLPRRFSRPSELIDLVPVLLGNALLPLLFIVPCMGLVMALGLPEHPTRQFAILAAAIPFTLFAISWCVGLVLCCWPVRRDDDHDESEFVELLSQSLPMLGRRRA